jgi:hypothetical protein
MRMPPLRRHRGTAFGVQVYAPPSKGPSRGEKRGQHFGQVPASHASIQPRSSPEARTRHPEFSKSLTSLTLRSRKPTTGVDLRPPVHQAGTNSLSKDRNPPERSISRNPCAAQSTFSPNRCSTFHRSRATASQRSPKTDKPGEERDRSRVFARLGSANRTRIIRNSRLITLRYYILEGNLPSFNENLANHEPVIALFCHGQSGF